MTGSTEDPALKSVEEAWQDLLGRDLSKSHQGLADLVFEASADPVLLKLFPFTSMHNLCFSKCTKYPYYVLLWITPLGQGDFMVQEPLVPGGWTEGTELHSGSLQDCVRVASNRLANSNNVLHGDAESLGLC